MDVQDVNGPEVFITAVGRLLANTEQYSCEPIDVFFGGGKSPWALFTVNASLVTPSMLPLSLSSPALIKHILTTDTVHDVALGTVSHDRPAGSNISFLVSDADGRTAISQWHIVEAANDRDCIPSLQSLVSQTFATAFETAQKLFIFLVILMPFIIIAYGIHWKWTIYQTGKRAARIADLELAVRRDRSPSAASRTRERVRGAAGEEESDDREEETAETAGLLPPPYKADDESDDEGAERRGRRTDS
ncbi:hypothetical protein T439DRAFT_323054 [Meredithblackwellia eburnea MCA 4105]